MSSEYKSAMRILFVLLYLVSILPAPAYGQESGLKKGFNPKYRIKDLAMDTWTNKNGLISNNVISVLQAEDDYLWITSYNGLQKFDGDKFEIYDQTNVPYLSSNTIYEGTQDKNGNLWFCTGSSGIVGYNGKSFIKLLQQDSLPISVVSIFSDSKDNLWVGTKNNGLYKINTSGGTNKINQIPDLTIHDIAEDEMGNIWVATDTKGVFKITSKSIHRFAQSNGMSSNLISTVFPKEGTLYAGTLSGVNLIRNGQVENLKILKGEIINDLLVDDYGVLWIGSERGLIRHMLGSDTYELFSEEDGLPSKRVVDLFFDNEGSLWVCTYEGGLVRFKAGIITNLTIKDGLPTNQVHIINKQDDIHYIGTQDGSVNLYDGEKISQLKLNDDFKKDVIRDILFEDDVTWIANYKGLVKIQNDKQTYFNEKSGLPDNNIRTIFKDSQGIKWLGSRTGGLIRFDEAGNHEVYDKDSGLLTNYVLCVDEDSKGNLYIGTNAGGLSILSRSGELEQHAILKDNSGTLIFNMQVDENDNAWLCTNLGLFRYANGKIEKVNFDPTLKMEKFFDIVNDQEQHFWLTSPIGVLKVKKSALNQFFDKAEPFVGYELFGEEDGMESQECTGATKGYYDPETKKIWVPTFEGVAIIDPNQKILNQKVPKVYITKVQIDNSSIFPIEDGVKIKPGTFRYLFDVTALSFLAPSKVNFKYKLEGIDEHWSEPTKNRRIEYTNLPYGDYTLLVQASNNDGIWNSTGAKLSFTVLPHFFEAFWFRFAVVVFLILLIWGLYTWRVHDIKKTNRMLRKMNSELDRFVYSASHDLRGPLTSTMGLVNLALDEDDPKQNKEYFRLIKQCTDKMNHFINELINYSKNKNDAVEYREFKLKTLVDNIWSGLKERGTLQQISLESEFNEEESVTGDETRIKVILRNLMHNAIIFADPKKPDPTVKIELSQTDRFVTLSVSDNGLGIPKFAIERIFDMFFRANDNSIGSGLGLYVVQETAQKLDALVEVKSEEGKGSTFTINIPKPKKR
ncbi:MAG: two-component regulator propeller domain-containing protein [Reichenbachiella sp.]|uniref:sensor histidine kinase n=1 Tax=Reichenbachiella sp. TaxID=2184521 RepID=UPI0032666A2A